MHIRSAPYEIGNAVHARECLQLLALPPKSDDVNPSIIILSSFFTNKGLSVTAEDMIWESMKHMHNTIGSKSQNQTIVC